MSQKAQNPLRQTVKDYCAGMASDNAAAYWYEYIKHEIAARCGVSVHRVTYWLTGKSTPNRAEVNEICNLLDVEPEELGYAAH